MSAIEMKSVTRVSEGRHRKTSKLQVALTIEKHTLLLIWYAIRSDWVLCASHLDKLRNIKTNS